MKCASRRTSAWEKFSSSRHFGIRACICSANLVASPRDSRCASCCGVFAMGSRDYAGIQIEEAPVGSALLLAPPSPPVGERFQHFDRIVPADAAVGDALPVLERLARHDLLAVS